MPDLIWLLAGIKSQGKPDSCFDFTETLTVTGKWRALQSFSFWRQVLFETLELKFFAMQLNNSCIFLVFCVLPSMGGHSMQKHLQKLLTGLKYQYVNSEMSSMHRNQKRAELLKRMMRLGPGHSWELKMSEVFQGASGNPSVVYVMCFSSTRSQALL